MSEIVSLSLDEELKKNPELTTSDIKVLSEWCQKQPHLPTISDSSLAVFLHSNYYRIEPTKTSIENFYTMRTHIPELFANRDPLGDTNFGNAMMLPLEKTTKEGYGIILLKLLNGDASKFTIGEFGKFMFMVIDLWLYRFGTNKGHIIISDVQDVSLGHAARCNPMVVKKILFYLQEGLPVKLKGLHFFNATAGMEAILKIMKPFLKKELNDMLYLHPTTEGMEKFMPLEALPNELGGKAGPIMELHEAQMNDVVAHRDWFLNEELRSRVDETKRPGKAKSASDFFGVEGNFKTLDMD